MKILIYLFVMFHSFINDTNNVKIEGYKYAIETIQTRAEYKKYAKNYKHHRVSTELATLYYMGIGFREHLPENIFTMKDYMAEYPTVVKIKPSLNQLNKKSKAKLHFFFTEQRDKFFCIEVVRTDKRVAISYEERPSFGRSLIYLFKVEQDEISLIDNGIIHYN